MSVNATKQQARSVAKLVTRKTSLPVHTSASPEFCRGEAIWLAENYDGIYRWCFILEGSGLDAVSVAGKVNDVLRERRSGYFCEPINGWSFAVYPA